MLTRRLKNVLYNCCSRYSHNNTTDISNLLKTKGVGDNVEIQGWVKSIRNQKENVFIDVSDGSTDKKLQIFIPHNLKPTSISTGASIKAAGILKNSPKGHLELTAENIKVIGSCVISDGYPFAPRKHYTSEQIRQYLHLRPRTNTFSSLLRVRNTVNLSIHNYLNSEGFLNIQTPILTSNDCEGAGEVFKVIPENAELNKTMIKEGLKSDEAYFNRKVFLTVSGQLHLEAVAHGLSKVYCLGPTFRAENSKSRLHLSEFYMLEVEEAFLEDIKVLMSRIEKLIKHVTTDVLNKNDEDIRSCSKEAKTDFSWLDKPFNILDYDEVVKILENNGDKYKEKFDRNDGLAKEHELFLAHYYDNIPTFIINWPKHMKSFYMRECPNDENKVSALDLIVPNVGEVAGGSLRENDYDKLLSKVPNDPNINWYLDLRKFGSVPTGGFGLGFERYIQFVLNIPNIKDVIPFPRWPHNCSL